MTTTKIEWATHVWNPTTGCDQVSPGCDNCYALRMAKRLKGMGSAKYQRDGDPRTSGPGFGINKHPTALDAPLRWRKPRRIFVNSMSDLFHAGVPDEFIADVWAVMGLSHHTFQILTKRPARMRSLVSSATFRALVRERISRRCGTHQRNDLAVCPVCRMNTTGNCGEETVERWPLPNVLLGVSVEDQKRADLRIPALLDTPAAVRFLSCEPLLGSVDLTPWSLMIRGDARDRRPAIDWVIIGGESGPGARPLDTEWVRSLVGQCEHAALAAFVKQLGSAWATAWTHNGEAVALHDPKGGDPKHWPRALRVREFPTIAAASA